MGLQKTANAEEVAVRQLAAGTHRQRIIMLLCEQHGMTWEQAEAFLFDVEISHGPRLKSDRSLLVAIVLGAGFAGSFLLSVYLLGATLAKGAASLPAAVALFVIGFGLLLLVLAVVSRHQNLTRERHRCPHCGHLVNRLGHQDPIFLPRYEACTYYTYTRRVSTHHVEWKAAGEQEWDTYADFEILDICRKCRQTRRKRMTKEKVGRYRRRREQDEEYWGW